MADHSPSPSSALDQIYALAEARWRLWDAQRPRKGQRAASQPAQGKSSRGGKGEQERQDQSARQPRTEVTAAERRRAVHLRGKGKSLREISQALNRAVSTVSRILRQEGFEAGQAPQRKHRSDGGASSLRSSKTPSRRPTSSSRARTIAGRSSSPEIRELHARIARLESSLTALASAWTAMTTTRNSNRGGRRRSS